MENPNIYTDFKPFILGEDKYHVKIKYKFTIDLTNFKFIETIVMEYIIELFSL